MDFLNTDETAILAAVAALAEGNPFLPERVTSEQNALGEAFVDKGAVWHAESELAQLHPNLDKLQAVVEQFTPLLRDRLAKGASA